MDSNTALANYNTFTQNAQSPDQILQGSEQSLGVPGQQAQVSGLRQAITNTTNLLNNIPGSVQGRTANSLVTDAQANRQIANESAPVQKQLSDLGTKEQNAASDLSSNLTRAQNLASLKVSGQTAQQQALMDLYKTLLSKEESAQQLAETVRANKASESISQQNANTSAASAAAKGAAAPSTTDIATANNDLIKLRGADGYVSPQTYARAALQWAAAGYSLSDFNKNFKQYKNPDNPNYTL